MANRTTTLPNLSLTSDSVRPEERARPVSSRIAWLDWATLGAACLVFLCLCLYQLDLPGLYTDEAFDVIPSMQIVLGQPIELLPGASLDVLGMHFPLMSSSAYQGITSTYLAIPFFMLGGVNVFSLRVMTVLVGLAGLIISFFLARAWFGATTARLATLMLAVSPAWIFWSRLGVYVVSEVVPIAGGALLALTAWVRRRPLFERNGLLYLGVFLLGLGLTTKLLFLWYIVALALTAAILWGRQAWENRKTWVRQVGSLLSTAFFATLAFCMGAFPFLLYNLKTRGTFYTIRDNLHTSGHGVNNTALLRNLWGEADSLRVLLDGSYFWFQGALGRTYANILTPALFSLSAIGLVVLILLDRQRGKPELTRTAVIGTAMLALALVLSFALASGVVVGAVATVMLLVCVAAGLVGAFMLTIAALRSKIDTAFAGWSLLAFCTVAGGLWWFGGSGRPEGPAAGGFLGLWPIDAAGILFWLSGACLLLVLGWDRHPTLYQRAISATLALIGLVVAQSSVTVSGLWSTHLLVLLPLPQIIIATFATMWGRRLASRVTQAQTHKLWASLRVLPAVCLVGALILLDLGVDYYYHRDLTATGGGSTFSDAIYSLSTYLEQRNRKVVAMDWGFRRPVQLLTQGSIDPVEGYGLEEPPGPQFFSALRQMLTQPDNLYLFHPGEPKSASAYPRHDQFFAEVKAAGKTAVLEKTFYHRDGVPVYEIYSVR